MAVVTVSRWDGPKVTRTASDTAATTVTDAKVSKHHRYGLDRGP